MASIATDGPDGSTSRTISGSLPDRPIHTSAAPSPVNAHAALADTRASLGAGAVRYSFTATDFHRLPFAGLPAHTSSEGDIAGRCPVRAPGNTWALPDVRTGRAPHA